MEGFQKGQEERWGADPLLARGWGRLALPSTHTPLACRSSGRGSSRTSDAERNSSFAFLMPLQEMFFFNKGGGLQLATLVRPEGWRFRGGALKGPRPPAPLCQLRPPPPPAHPTPTTVLAEGGASCVPRPAGGVERKKGGAAGPAWVYCLTWVLGLPLDGGAGGLHACCAPSLGIHPPDARASSRGRLLLQAAAPPPGWLAGWGGSSCSRAALKRRRLAGLRPVQAIGAMQTGGAAPLASEGRRRAGARVGTPFPAGPLGLL